MLHGETISPAIQSERSEDIVPQGYRLAAGKISSERSEDIVIRWAVAGRFPIIGKI